MNNRCIFKNSFSKKKNQNGWTPEKSFTREHIVFPRGT